MGERGDDVGLVETYALKCAGPVFSRAANPAPKPP
jgi:hypothetical protein